MVEPLFVPKNIWLPQARQFVWHDILADPDAHIGNALEGDNEATRYIFPGSRFSGRSRQMQKPGNKEVEDPEGH